MKYIPNKLAINTCIGQLEIFQNLNKGLDETIPVEIINTGAPRLLIPYREDVLTVSYSDFRELPQSISNIYHKEYELKNIGNSTLIEPFRNKRFMDYFIKKPVNFIVKNVDSSTIHQFSSELMQNSNIYGGTLIEFQYQGYIYYALIGDGAFKLYQGHDMTQVISEFSYPNIKAELVVLNDKKWAIGRSDSGLDFNSLYTSYGI